MAERATKADPTYVGKEACTRHIELEKSIGQLGRLSMRKVKAMGSRHMNIHRTQHSGKAPSSAGWP